MDIEQALEIVSQTHPGVVRSHNEDSVAYDASCGLVVLADGMGGHNAGEIASGITVSLIATDMRHSLESMRPEDRGDGGEDVGVILLREKVASAATPAPAPTATPSTRPLARPPTAVAPRKRSEERRVGKECA